MADEREGSVEKEERKEDVRVEEGEKERKQEEKRDESGRKRKREDHEDDYEKRDEREENKEEKRRKISLSNVKSSEKKGMFMGKDANRGYDRGYERGSSDGRREREDSYGNRDSYRDGRGSGGRGRYERSDHYENDRDSYGGSSYGRRYGRDEERPRDRPRREPKEGWLYPEEIDFRQNPHLRQVQLQGLDGTEKVKLEESLAFSRVLPNDHPKIPYTLIPHQQRSVNHWGQRKLMLSEVEFLTLYARKSKIAVYAGAAPGSHIPFLSGLFPDLQFYLIDPADFSPGCKESPKINTFQEFFDEQMIAKLKGEFGEEKVLFISDVRSADPKVLPKEEVERCVARDMEAQMDWAVEMDPVASMLKFRLPYGAGKSNYLDGKIYLPVWGPQTTTETRLVTEDHSKRRVFDNTEYEQQMFHFNKIDRVKFYEHDFEAPGLDHCFDCASEIVIVTRYFEFARKTYGQEEKKVEGLHSLVVEYLKRVKECEGDEAKEKEVLKDIFYKMSEELSRECSPGGRRTLQDHIRADQRKQWFSARVFDPVNRKVSERSSEAKSLQEMLKQDEKNIHFEPRNLNSN